MSTQTNLFHAERAHGLGGSDIGGLYSLDYGCKRKLTFEKSGAAPDFPEVYRPEFERGHYVEDVVARMYADKTKRKVEAAGMMIRPGKPWMLVHMDRIVHAPEHPGPGYLEIKVVNARTYKKWKEGGVADYVILQVQHGLAVTSYQWGSYAILCLEPWQFMWCDVERDADLIAKLETDEEEFMLNMDLGFVPEKLPLKDKRCAGCVYRATCHGEELQQVIPQDERERELTERQDLLPLACEIQELDTMKDDVSEMLDLAKAQMLQEIGKADGVRFQGGRFLRIQGAPRTTWDSKALTSLFDAGSDRLKEILKKFRKTGDKPKPFVRGYWTGDK